MDLIDRQALLEQCHWIIRSDGSRVFACHAEDIESAPTAQPTRSEIRRMAIQQEVFKPKRGEWIVKINALGKEYTVCSTCKSHFSIKMADGSFGLMNMMGADFCPNCGAEMRGQTDAE